MTVNQNNQPYRRTELLNIFLLLVSIYLIFAFYNYIFHNQFVFWVNSCDQGSGKTNSPPTIPKFKWNNTGIITLWFDDATISQYTAAYKIMQQEQLKGAISIATSLLCRKSNMTWDQLRTLQNSGWETTSHTISHSCDLQFYTDSIAEKELVKSKQIIQDHGLRADQFVMPCGYSENELTDLYGDEAPPLIAIAKQNYSSYRTAKAIRINKLPLLDPYNLKAFVINNTITLEKVENYISSAKKNHGWLIIVFHRIDNSGKPFSITENKFKDIIQLVKNSNLPVVLPSQALEIRQGP